MSVPMSESSQSIDSSLPFERERGVYAVHVTRDVAHALIPVGDDTLRSHRIQQVFQVLKEADVPVFLIKMHRTVVTLAFAGEDTERAEKALQAAQLSARTRRDLALLAVRAASMRDLSGIMVDISDALYHAGARLFETGDSHNSVQCLIEEARVEEAVDGLCRAFRLDVKSCRENALGVQEAA